MKNLSRIVFTILSLLAGIRECASQGTNDPAFNVGTGADGYVNVIAVQHDGKIICGGSFSDFNGNTNCAGLARLDPDGSVDDSFNPGANSFFTVFCTAIQPDGKIIIGGNFGAYQGVTRWYLARINTDGALDLSFDPGTGLDDYVNSMSLQPDGKVVIGGSFTTYNGTNRSGIARVNADGSLDTTFDPGTGVDYAVFSTCLLTNGQIMIAGGFTLYNGVGRRGMARLNSDGSLDTTFDPGSVSVNDVVRSLVPQPDGRLIVGGYFTNFDGISRNRIARVNTDGSLDTSFDPGGGFNDEVICLALQPNGKILAGGYFTSLNSVTRIGVARLLPNGNVDANFDAGTNLDGEIGALALQTDAKVLCGGYFTDSNGILEGGPARLFLADAQPTPLIARMQATRGNAVLSWNSATNGIYQVQYKSSLAATNWTALNPNTLAIGGMTSLTNGVGTNSSAYYRVAFLPF